ISESIAELVSTSTPGTMRTWFGMFVHTNLGGRLDSSTLIVKRFVTLNATFDTVTKTEFVDGPCASRGVQKIKPFVMVNPAGPFTIANDSGSGGVSRSVARQLIVVATVSRMLFVVVFVGKRNCGGTRLASKVTLAE